MSRKGIFALEEIAENAEVNATVVDTPVVIDESAGAEDLAEAEGHLAAGEEIESAADDAASTVDAIGEIRKEVGNSLAEGGMSEPEARALEVAVEHMCAAIGMSKKQIFPAMEGFADKKGRIGTTKLAMENLGEKAKEIGQRIIKAILAALEYAKKFFASLFNAIDGLKKKADQIVEATKKAEGKDTKGQNVSGGFLGLLTVDGKYQVGNALVTAYETHTSSEVIKFDRLTLIKEVAPILEQALSDKDAASSDAATAEVMETLKKDLDFEPGDDKYTSEQKLVFGGQSFYLEIKETSARNWIGDSSNKHDVSELKEAPALSIADVASLASKVSTHMDAYKALGKDVNVLGGEFNAIIQKVKAAVAGQGSVTSTIYSQIQMVNNLTVGASKMLRSYDVKVSSAILEYCVKSLKSVPKPEKVDGEAAIAKPAAA